MKPQERVGIRTLSTHLAARQGFERVLSIWGLKRTRFSVYTAPPPRDCFSTPVVWGSPGVWVTEAGLSRDGLRSASIQICSSLA